jgi:DNA invertase Pin-like site-specific DNA recombinase
MKNKVFAYCRVSSAGQAENDRDGLPRQREAIECWAREHGAEVEAWFEDKGVSGTKDLAHRPALQELVTALHANGVRIVVIEKLDRLARDLMIQESILADFWRDGFEVVSVAEPDLLGTDPTRILLRQMMGAFAQYERTMIVLKLKAARQRKRARGERCEGRKPYGATAEERAVIDRMFELYDKGRGYTAVHKDLNAEGIPARDGGVWTATTVMRIMKRQPARLQRMGRRKASRGIRASSYGTCITSSSCMS